MKTMSQIAASITDEANATPLVPKDVPNEIQAAQEVVIPPPPGPPPPPPPPPPPFGAAMTPLFTKGADRTTFMAEIHVQKKAIDDLIAQELQLILNINPGNVEQSKKELASIREQLGTKQWPLSDLGKKYSRANTDLEKFLATLDADSMKKLTDPKTKLSTKTSILKPGLAGLTPIVKEIETLFAGRPIDLELEIVESDWIKSYESLKANILEIERDIQRVHTLTPALTAAANNPSSIYSLARLACDEYEKAAFEIARLEAKKRELQNEVSETIRSFRLGQAYSSLVEIGLYLPISDMIKKLNSVEKKTQGPAAEKQKTKTEVAPREKALIDFINGGLTVGSTSAGTPLADAELTQRIQHRICQKIGVGFLLLQQEYPDCFKTDWSFDYIKVGNIFSEKLLDYCISMREEEDHQNKLKLMMASRSGTAFPPNGAPFRETVERLIQMDLETGLPLSQEDLTKLYSDEVVDSNASASDEAGMDIDIGCFDPNASVDADILALLQPEDEIKAGNETCSEGSAIEDFGRTSPRP